MTLDKTSSRLPTDASAFVSRDVPILSAFTGAHEDYHTPRDTKEKLNYEGAASTAKLFALLSRGFLTDQSVPGIQIGRRAKVRRRSSTRAFDRIAGHGSRLRFRQIKGQKLSAVRPSTPAAEAGIKGGDIVIELAGRKIEDIYDYTYAIEALKIGEETEIVVRRGEESLTLKVTPAARD